jgi:hypothetical protein
MGRDEKMCDVIMIVLRTQYVHRTPSSSPACAVSTSSISEGERENRHREREGGSDKVVVCSLVEKNNLKCKTAKPWSDTMQTI